MTDPPREDRFNPTNPPPNEEAAKERLDELASIIIHIETKLEHAGPADYPDDATYDDWRRRAVGAVAHRRREERFLQNWLAMQEKRSNSGPSRRELAGIAQMIKERAKTLAKAIGAGYTPVYSTTNAPPDLPAARDRMCQLTELRQRLQEAFTE